MKILLWAPIKLRALMGKCCFTGCEPLLTVVACAEINAANGLQSTKSALKVTQLRARLCVCAQTYIYAATCTLGFQRCVCVYTYMLTYMYIHVSWALAHQKTTPKPTKAPIEQLDRNFGTSSQPWNSIHRNFQPHWLRETVSEMRQLTVLVHSPRLLFFFLVAGTEIWMWAGR